MNILGLDIGGANIKAADEAGRTVSRPFAMWKRHEQLADEIALIFSEFPQTERVAVTMTAELADCFATKSEGVRFILNAVAASVARTLRVRSLEYAEAPHSESTGDRKGDSESEVVSIWTTAGRFLSVEEAASQPMLVAAANWYALATWCGRGQGLRAEGRGTENNRPSDCLSVPLVPLPSALSQSKAPLTLTLSPEDGGEGTKPITRQSADSGSALDTRHSTLDSSSSVLNTQYSALLIDIGTTTTDIIPIIGGRVAAQGLTDVGRLQSGELSYSGVKRTPVCAIAHAVPFREGYCPLAAELFATTLDVYLLLGDIVEDEHDTETANGQPATIAAAHDRLARALCCDRDEVSFDEAVQIARFLADVQRQRLAGSLERVASRFETPMEAVIISGSGSFLARRLVAENRRTARAKIISLDDHLSPGIAEAACAYAVAQLLAGDFKTGQDPSP